MGNTWTVLAWQQVDGGYRDVCVYRGESMLRALAAAARAKRTHGCVKIEWRA